MSSSFNMEEFIDEGRSDIPVASSEEEIESPTPELDIQKAVVESLAADKAALEVKIANLEKELAEKDAVIAEKTATIEKNAEAVEKNAAAVAEKSAAVEELESRVKSLQSELYAAVDKMVDEQPRNPGALALLDRDIELPDRFPGETRDHLLEVIAEAREAAEKAGRVRRAQVLEAVLVANEPNGELAKRRAELEKLFAASNNLLTGEVLEELKKRGISHKSGEDYLMPSEILKRTY